MPRRLTAPIVRAKRQVADDLRSDPYLAYILLLAAALCSFWIWHRVPNFATRDERWRIVDIMEAIGFYIQDPSVDSLRDGIIFWRSYGATFYLYGIVLLPLLCYLALTGGLEQLTGLSKAWTIGHWTYWQILPSWVWSVAIVSARLVNVTLAVGCVYLIYRIGTMLRDRATGRLASTTLALTWGLVVLAHEAGEDVPALFFLLLTFIYALAYVETGSSRRFLGGCLFGGVAIAFKLTAGVGVVLLAGAYLLRARRHGTTPMKALFRPTMLVSGAAIGIITVYIGFPSAVSGGIDVLVDRVIRGTTAKGSSHGWLRRPSWWWLLRGYLNGLGFPLFVGTVAAVVAAFGRLRYRQRSIETDGMILSLLVVGATLLVFSRWAYIRTHHLLLTVPFLLVLLAVVLQHTAVQRPRLARVATVVLLVTSAFYTGLGTVGYATQPRDQAAEWLTDHAAENATVETYATDPQDAAVPYAMTTHRPNLPTSEEYERVLAEWVLDMPERCPTYIQLNYQTSFMYLAPDNHSERASDHSNPRVRAYYHDLLAEDTYPYEVVARFGREPRFLRTAEPRPVYWEILRAGIYPRTNQYGDPQDFGVDQYTVILERTEASCVG